MNVCVCEWVCVSVCVVVFVCILNEADHQLVNLSAISITLTDGDAHHMEGSTVAHNIVILDRTSVVPDRASAMQHIMHLGLMHYS